MKMNLAGRVEKLRLGPTPTNSLHPLFEAVVNSVHAIRDRNHKRGRIDIHVERNKKQGVLQEGSMPFLVDL